MACLMFDEYCGDRYYNVIFTILAMFVVDRWGRKALTLIGSFGLAVIYTFMGGRLLFFISQELFY